MSGIAIGNSARLALPQALSRIFFGLMCVCTTGSAWSESYLYSYVDSGKVTKENIIIRPAPVVGRCSFSLGAKDGDNFLIMEIIEHDEYVVAKSSIWTLYIPKKRPFPEKWFEGDTEFRYMGKEWVAVGLKNILAEKIGIFGGKINESTEIWVSDKYGVLAYRPMENSGRFTLTRLPSNSLLNCR